ncbi:unnamed protein product [Albugo candida]|uniref:Uncharacterized protein n=1 Tax=Albugo candida TaxID=65357 RepID=A0A024G002_9STRA|nr:unnamed protein product [Albugo candida]|eukprot:CCI40091.1 unnamed protein product [Albugo candida]
MNMNDPFASLDPLAKPKTVAERLLDTSSNSRCNPLPVQSPDLIHHANASRMGDVGIHAYAGNMINPGQPNANYNYNNMGGMGNIQLMDHNMANTPMAQPVMYENIRNLLQQKPKVVNMESSSSITLGDSSLDFLETLGSPSGFSKIATRVPETVNDTFSSEVVSNDGKSIHNGNGSSKEKKGALADRLSVNRRITQEVQRAQLHFSADAFGPSEGTSKLSGIGLKNAAKSPNSLKKVMTVDEFAGNETTYDSDTIFGGVDVFSSQNDSFQEPSKSSGSVASESGLLW